MKYCLLILTFVLLGFTEGRSQLITHIEFVGNEKTKTSLLEDQITAAVGDSIDIRVIENDLNALKSLYIFSDVEYELFEQEDNRVKLRYTVEEVFTILPVANLGGISNDHAFWITLGVNEFNAFGRGDIFSINYRYFERHSLELFYELRKFKSRAFGLGSFVSIKSSIEPLYFSDDVTAFYDFTQWRIEELISYYKSWNSKIYFGGGFFREQYLVNEEKTNADFLDFVPTRVISDKITLKGIYSFEDIDYFGHIEDGIRFQSGTDFIYNINERDFSDALFVKTFLELKSYTQISSKGNVAHRAFLGFSTNNGSPFVSFVKDDYINARGVGDRSSRGYIELTYNVEWRQTLLWKNAYYFQTVLFTDVSGIVPSGAELIELFDTDNIDAFSGLGIRLGLPNIYKTVIRADLSFDYRKGNISSIIFGLGQFF